MNRSTHCLLAFALLVLAPNALGWGRFGHEVTGHLATFELNETARVAIASLLDGESLASATLWADQVRPDRPATAPFHYINGPTDRLEPEPANWNLTRGTAHSAVLGYAEILADQDRPDSERREALKFLIHFIGDLHQPLHAGFGEDRGGNDIPVVYQDELINLHRYWDSGILDPHSQRYSSAEFAAILFHAHGPEQRQRWAATGEPREWVLESRRYIFSGLYPPPRTDQGAIIDGPVGVIDESYAEVWRPVAERQLARAGSRIARTLNLIFISGRSPFPPPPIEFPPAE
jgi:hypothetical protein